MRFSLVSLLAVAGSAFAQTAIDQATFDNIIQYTRFSRAAYAATPAGCATPPNGSVVLNYFNDATTDAHATLFRWDAAMQIVLSFRGTYTPGNYGSDFDFGLTKVTLPGTSCANCLVHTGFQKLYNALAGQVTPAVKSALAANPGYTLIITGHSLGGALASLASASLGASGVRIAATYTYGEPRNGNDKWSSYVLTFVPLANYFRATHANDAVPSLPPNGIFGYVHHGNEYWQQASGYNNTVATTVKCAPPAGKLENLNCNLAQFSTTPINRAHVTYSNDVVGNVLHIHDCGAPFP